MLRSLTEENLRIMSIRIFGLVISGEERVIIVYTNIKGLKFDTLSYTIILVKRTKQSISNHSFGIFFRNFGAMVPRLALAGNEAELNS